MPAIQLQSEMDSHFTAVPHRFIEEYMPSANGEFVKVYLYLLHSLRRPGRELSLSLLADRLFCTEKDVTRALGYWEKQGLLSLARDGRGQPTEIVLREIACETKPYGQTLPDGGNDAYHGPIQPGSGRTDAKEAPAHPTASADVLHTAGPGDEAASQKNGAAAYPPGNTPPDGHGTSASGSAAPSVPQFTRDKLESLKQDEDFSQLLFLTEMYLGKTLNPTEVNSLCYYYDTLKFPADLIEYLVESCVSKGHKSFHYIEVVAQRWHSTGIRTVQEAKQQSSQYTRQYYSVLRAFGITDRSPIEQEIHMIDHWMNDLGFSTEMICEACGRTIRAIGKASFSYADSILSNWQKQKVHNLKDLEVIDARHAGAKPPKADGKGKNPQANNRFNNFSQREYDYRELEQQLLKKQ